MVAVLGYSKEQIREAVREMYTLVASRPSTPLHFPIGRIACEKALYDPGMMEQVPTTALDSFAGVGCPFKADVIQPGHTVLDVGSGSGTDVSIAARLVGDKGKVWALDLTPAMRDKLQGLVEQHGLSNITVLEGDAESIPLPDESVDVVTSNGVLNLVADKRAAIREIFRVVRPGGYVQIADIVIASPVTPDCEDDPRLWAECVVGATVDENYLNMFRDAGFEQVEVQRDYDYFAYSPSEETREVARQFGAHAFELRMQRGAREPARVVQYAKRLDPRRLARDINRRGLIGVAGLGLALLACYGTLAVVAVFSLLGLSLALNENLWAGAIVAAALMTTIIITIGMRKHRSPLPPMLACAGTLVLVFSFYVSYSILVELLGFLLLAIACWYDFNCRRWAKVAGGKSSRENRRTSFVRNNASA